MNEIHIFNKRLCLIIAFTAILVGGIIYYLFLPDVLFVKAIDNVLPFSIHFSVSTTSPVIVVLRYYLFDFLWALSLTSCISLFYDNFHIKSLLMIFSTVSITEIVLELIQLSAYIPGHFDYRDIVVELSADIITLSVLYFVSRYEAIKRRK